MCLFVCVCVHTSVIPWSVCHLYTIPHYRAVHLRRRERVLSIADERGFRVACCAADRSVGTDGVEIEHDGRDVVARMDVVREWVGLVFSLVAVLWRLVVQGGRVRVLVVVVVVVRGMVTAAVMQP